MSYTPNFIPSDIPCEIPVFIERRSRLLKNGLFFRSLIPGGQANNISVAVLMGGENTIGQMVTQSISVKIYINDVEVETFIAHQQKNISVVGTEADHYNQTGFSDLRAKINANSLYIEMTERSYDVEDVIPNDPSDVIGFDKTAMTGANGGPSNGSIIDSIRTGPDSTLIGLKSTENAMGQNVDPPSAERIKKWNGTEWVSAQ